MGFGLRLLGMFASESFRAIFLFLGIMSVVVAIALVSATIVAAYTGDWNLPGVVSALVLFVSRYLALHPLRCASDLGALLMALFDSDYCDLGWP